MVKKTVITPNDFDVLLGWLDENRDKAAEKYEKIRQRLIQIFCNRGCYEAEELADETFDRVARKLPGTIETYRGEPALYFYGVANNVYHEWIRRQARSKPLEFEEEIPAPVEAERATEEIECLKKCLTGLSYENRRLVVSYYSKQKRSRIELRKHLAGLCGITPGALQIRVYRIRQTLRECITGCLKKKL